MLIRYLDRGLREIPDELAVLILADPATNEDISEYSSHWVNVIVHGVLGTLFDSEKIFEDNVDYAINELSEVSAERRKQALKLIKQYNIEVKDKDVGMFPADDMI